MDLPYVILKPNKERSLQRQHPWVFSGAIQSRHGKPRSGDRVAVRSADGTWHGWGHYTKGQSIAVRMLDFKSPEPSTDFWAQRIQIAVALRDRLELMDGPATNSCRLVHGEGDGLPGLIIDWYAGVIVMQLHTLGMLTERGAIVAALQQVLGNRLIAVYDKSANVLQRHHSIEHQDAVVLGKLPEKVIALENQHEFEVDVIQGQKTGFFLDQRDNRSLLQSCSKGARVLNVFSYTAGFSVAALGGGAREVHSLDSSARALEVGDENVARNGHADCHRSIEADALDYLRDHAADYDIVVLDPPAFAKGSHAKNAAVQAYKRLNASAMRSMPSGSLLFTFSCSQAVDEAHFTQAVLSGALSANRSVQILRRLHQPADHPVAGGHPEGAYLKGLLLRLD